MVSQLCNMWPTMTSLSHIYRDQSTDTIHVGGVLIIPKVGNHACGAPESGKLPARSTTHRPSQLSKPLGHTLAPMQRGALQVVSPQPRKANRAKALTGSEG